MALTKRQVAGAAAASLIGFGVFVSLSNNDIISSTLWTPSSSSSVTHPSQSRRSLLSLPGKKRPHINPLLEKHIKPFVSEPNPAKETVTFWHVPKSGGTTLKEIYKCMGKTLAVRGGASTHFGDDKDEEITIFESGNEVINVDTLTRKGILRAKKLKLVQSGKVDLIVTSGSLNFAIQHLYDKAHKGRVLGLFRHPVERLISQFFNRQMAIWSDSEWKESDIVYWAENIVEEEQNNLLVKTLVGLDRKSSVITEEDLSMAIRTMRHKIVIGLTDLMEESIHRFNVFMGVNEGQPGKRECMNQYFGHGVKKYNSNRHPMVPKGSPAWQAVAAKNEFDVRLYMAIVEEFNNQQGIIASYAKAARDKAVMGVAEEMEEQIGSLQEEMEKLMSKMNPPLPEEADQTKRKPTAVIHVGPPKTGSSSLQVSLKQSDVLSAFTSDGYSMPWFLLGKDTPSEYVFATCFLEDKKKAARGASDEELCPEAELMRLRKFGEEGENIFLSAESFSSADPAKIADFMEPYWDIVIIYFHRWFHDWVFSMYHQVEKSDLYFYHESFEHFQAGHGSGNVYHNRYLEWFDKIYKYDFEWGGYQTYYKYKEQFENVVTLDFNDKSSGIQEKVFCDGVPNAVNTCKYFQSHSEGVKNPSKPLVYRMIAYDANMLGLTKFCSMEQFQRMSWKIKNYQQNTLGLSQFDFPMRCLNDAVIQRLIDLSIEHRRNILNSSPLSEAMEKEVRMIYWMKVKDKACHADTRATLGMPEWVEFINTWNEENPCP